MEISKEIIMENINEPQILEEMFQSNKKAFTESIKLLYEYETNVIIRYWYARLFHKAINKKSRKVKYIITAILVILAWIPIRLIIYRTYSDSYVYLYKSIPVVCSVALSLFFLLDSIKIKNILLSILPHIIVYIYFLLLPMPNDMVIGQNSDNVQVFRNAYFFMFVLLCFFILFAKSNCNIKKLDYNGFIEKTGETIIWSTIFIIGGAVIIGLSLALFNAIKIDAWNFYFENIATLGLVASPFVSLLIIENNKRIKLSVIIANIFLPLILVSLVVFGVISMFTESKPYENRDIFISYNVMMVIVICVLIFTSINNINNKFINICFYILPVVTILLDIITISAVIYRLDKYGISPNKITLLGINIIMLGHLAYIVYLKIKNKVEKNILYLPVYFLWAFGVVFIMPFIFTNGIK